MVAQLRLLDPSVSAEIGTPERKILDTVAQALADSQIDLTVLQGALDLDSKYGQNLDNFIALFGFARQEAAYAEGFVEFGRLMPSTTDIRIPANTRVQAVSEGIVTIFATTFDVTLPAGLTKVLAPIRAVTPGSTGNVAANTISTTVGDPVFGITTVNNPQPTLGGLDAESDNQLKVRFKNTIFRNLAGTEDQYLALAVATPYSTKANVVGPISRYREYIQVPEVDDATAYDIDGDTVLEPGNGITGEYTSALSSIPYSKYVYTDAPVFVSNGEFGAGSIFYRRDVDFRVNTEGADKNKGDSFRLDSIGRGDDPTDTPTRPNITFTNVYAGTDPDIQSIRPNDVVLFEHSYLSTASRNDLDRNITNCVDVYVDGGNITLGTVILPAPTTANLIVDNPASKFHYALYRRKGQPEVRPQLGNILMPLMHQPILDVPDQIKATMGGLVYTFVKDEHYWGIEDATILGGTVRARGGIEWNMDLPATLQGHSDLYITDPAIETITVEDYSYDKAISDLQAAYESNKQVTTDVLAHRAKRRYFKLDITVMYTPGSSVTETNLLIRSAVQNYFTSQHLGTTVQLSDLLQAIHSLPQVDNVRWTSDVPGAEDQNRMQETDEFGRPLVNILTRRRRRGTATLSDIQELIITGTPTAGNYALLYGDTWTTAIPYNANAGTIGTALNAISANLTSVTGTGTHADPFVITFSGTGQKSLIQGTPVPQRVLTTVATVNGFRNLHGNDYIINNDFFLQDNELPSLAVETDDTTPGAYSDTVPGMIIRPRAQNTWNR
jgi:uncharacterized phage protein gp47/JayE